MLMALIFDKDIDIIDVPPFVIDNKDCLRNKFIRWLYSKKSKMGVKRVTGINGASFYGVQYRSDTFVDWLNKKVLDADKERARVLKQQVAICPDNIPQLFF